ncbi:hypothetical protein BGZ76_002809, partial [Entomortierella beljakovae]
SYIITGIDDEGMHMAISATIPNPSTIGMTIPVAIFETSFHGKVLGPAVADGLVLIPHGSSSFALNVTISAANGDLSPYLSGIFENALGGIATELDAQGVSAPGISWLDAAIKALSLHTSLPPLTNPPIESISIDAMSMDFSCDTCIWSPQAISTITAKTNLPFANGAPIIQLSQHIQIIDKNGQPVGLLNTPYAAAKATGDVVTSTSVSAPLEVFDGSHEIFESFIGDLSEATSYQLGLNGTSDSILDLGLLGKVEVKGIKVDVQTSLDGLQGLKKIDFYAMLGLDFKVIDGLPFAYIPGMVNIHNPSKLTLTLGDLVLNGGVNYTEAGQLAKVHVDNMVLVPGDNYVDSITLVDALHPAADTVVNGLFSGVGGDIDLYLSAFEGSSSNPALVAGLKDLQTSIILPKDLFVANATTPYLASPWSLKFLPSTVDDGLVEFTGTFQNPYPGYTLHVHSINMVSPSGIQTKNSIYIFKILDNIQYDLAPQETRIITFKVAIDESLTKALIQKLVDASSIGSLEFQLELYPVITLGNDPTLYTPLWPSIRVFPDTPLSVETGPDFQLFLDWYNKRHPVVPALVSQTTIPSSTGVSPTMASSPVPTISPVSAASPIPSLTPSPVPSVAP